MSYLSVLKGLFVGWYFQDTGELLEKDPQVSGTWSLSLRSDVCCALCPWSSFPSHSRVEVLAGLALRDWGLRKEEGVLPGIEL